MNKKYLKPYYLLLSIYYVILACYLFVAFAIPLRISSFIDICVKTGQIFNYNLFLLIGFIITEVGFSILKNDMNIVLSNKIAFHIEYEISDRIKHSKYDEIRKYDDAYLAQRLNNDSCLVGDYICEKLPYFFVDVAFVAIVLLYILKTDFSLGLFFAAAVVLYVLVYVACNKKLYIYAEAMFDVRARFFSMLSSQFNSVLLIKINSWYKEKNEEFKAVVVNFLKKSLRYLRLDYSIKIIGVFFSRILMIVALCRIGLRILHGETSVGLMTGFLLYVELIASHLGSALNFGDSFQKYKLSKERLNELASFSVEGNGEKELSEINSIKVQNICYSMEENRKITYPNIVLKKGNIYILKGENGTGKSTLTYLLLGILKETSGSILYNGIPLHDINKENLRRNCIAVKNQEPYIVDGSLRENLLFGGQSEISSEVKNFVFSFLHFAKSRDFLDMQINHKNTELSGGEQQRVAICRALVKNTDFIILDEPTNGLDEEAKKELTTFLQLITEKIILIISHDKCFDDIANEVISLK